LTSDLDLNNVNPGWGNDALTALFPHSVVRKDATGVKAVFESLVL